MNSDLSKELLRKINKSFTLSYQNSKKVRKLLEAIKNKDCDYLKAMDYAEEVGRILAEAYMKNLSSDVLPDGKMYYDIASAILNPTLENNYGLISSYVCGAMDVMNEKAGIEAKARKPPYNIDKTIGLIKKVSDAEYFDDVKNYLNEPVITNALSIVDEGARVNADLHYNMNHKPVIVRKASFGCCDWCRSLSGTHEYYPTMNRDIFRRHQNCRCTVIYDPRNSDGKVQDVYTKEWEGNTSDYQDVTQIYYKTSKPNTDKLIIPKNYKISTHKEEIPFAHFIYETFGGPLELISEEETEGIKSPDYIWKNKYWELKTLTTNKAVDSALRKGLKQIKNNPGGIFLDVRNVDKYIDDELIRYISRRISRSYISEVDVMIVESNTSIKVLRYKKKG